MSQSASQAAIFYRDVETNGVVWTIKDENGYPAPLKSNGRRAMPFWSSRSRVELIIKNVKAYSGFEPVELDLKTFESYWLFELMNENQLVGINWSGRKAVGYDLEPRAIKEWLNQVRPKKSVLKRIFRK